jgi:uncharacterized membrane protein
MRKLTLGSVGVLALGGLLLFVTDDSFDRTVPTRVPSGLKPGGNIQ